MRNDNLPEPGTLARRCYDAIVGGIPLCDLPKIVDRSRFWFWRVIRTTAPDFSNISDRDAERLFTLIAAASSESSRRSCELNDLLVEASAVVQRSQAMAQYAKRPVYRRKPGLWKKSKIHAPVGMDLEQAESPRPRRAPNRPSSVG